MNYIIANPSLPEERWGFPPEPPTLSIAGLQIVCREGMPRFDFIEGEWVERKPDDSRRYSVAAYEAVDFFVGTKIAARIMVRRMAEIKIESCQV